MTIIIPHQGTQNLYLCKEFSVPVGKYCKLSTHLVRTSSCRLLMVAFLFLTATVARQMVTITTPSKTIRNVARSPITSPSVFPVPELPDNVKFVFSVGVVISRDKRI